MEYQEEYTNPSFGCKKCRCANVWFTEDETYDCYPRYHYHCHSCGYKWSVVDESD